MNYEQLREMFPNVNEKDLLEEIEKNNYNIEQTLNTLLNKQDKQIIQPQIIVPKPQIQIECNGSIDKCGCNCHTNIGSVFHVFPCCYVCNKCGGNIPTNLRDTHDIKKEIKKPIFIEQQWQINPQPLRIQEEYEQVCIKVANMVGDNYSLNLASKHGLNIVYASWEDNGRNKESSWGPCISDMTLQVGDRMMPVIRQPNFTDLTWDVPMEKIPLVVGNENNDPLYQTNLKEYLKDVRSYLTKPNTWKGNVKSLYCEERDSQVIMSSQTCFLPVPKSTESKFNVALMNYQSTQYNPAVLAIVSTSNGTSCQLVTNAGGWNGQKLFFNNNGQKASFLAQRLSDNRLEKGLSLNNPISEKEKQQNMVMIIQVPVKVKSRVIRHHRKQFLPNVQCMINCSPHSYAYDDIDEEQESFNVNKMSNQSENFAFGGMELKKREKSNVEHAIIKVGEDEGEFPDFNNLEIERDTKYPVRVTLQYYKATSNGVIDEEVISQISNELKESRKYATSIGSLVVNNSNRPTEFDKQHLVKVAPWWGDWWIINQQRFNYLTENQAREKVFKNGRFVDSSLNDVENRLYHILSSSNGSNDPNIQWIL
eukprot:TRINITY_DN6504_c0_g1_i1.p1 TRINITY_DN6504_c0_g1~~TRINITY_DN6504_c0_g1_i1.p1  ORF type:complete len:592 (+),score=180.15 TRINITY_DN6504_c0_g1_i1:30-1805(+)